MKKTTWFFVFFFLSFQKLTWAQYMLSGGVIRNQSTSVISNANVQLKGTRFKTRTDEQGNFKFPSIPEGMYEIQVSFLGYSFFSQMIDLKNDVNLKIVLNPMDIISEEVVVRGIRAGKEAPTTYINLDKKEIEANNFGQDLPFVLQNTPNVVVNSDAGAGVGYTAMRVRGTDGQRTNVTINGIPYNDSESAGTFFVNMGDFSSSVNNIQIQRGVGTSTNGAGAFGASINIQTSGTPAPLPSVEINNTFGSFRTLKNTLNLSSGLINDQFSFDARLSKINSDGYIDRASADLKSFFLSGAYHGKKDLMRLNVFSGTEKTYQAWYGVDEAFINDKEQRKQNYYTYPNQTDNYKQSHYQLLYNRQISSQWSFNGALHYTRGVGYYEEYKQNQILVNYLFPDIDVNVTSDLIRQRWLDNHFYGTTYNFNFQPSHQWNVTLGGAANKYKGGHYGDVIWAQNYPVSLAERNFLRYYDNDGNKNEYNFYLKTEYNLSEKWLLFADLQYRNIFYKVLGPDENFARLDASYRWQFFNPKAGITYKFSGQNNMYLSYSQENREPVRSDIVSAGINTLPKSEKLHDIEWGYRLRKNTYGFNVNLYGMVYKDQLVETGKINDVGAPIRQNVSDSYRLGIEMDGGVQLNDKIRLNGNLALSRNKIKEYIQYVSLNDAGDQKALIFKNTDIAFSPSVVGFGELVFNPVKNLALAWQHKYVGKQFLDNTQNADRSGLIEQTFVEIANRKIAAYYISNLRVGYDFSVYGIKNIHLGLLVNNIFNKLYVSNGYTYTYVLDGTIYPGNSFYPQATTNFLFSLNIKF